MREISSKTKFPRLAPKRSLLGAFLATVVCRILFPILLCVFLALLRAKPFLGLWAGWLEPCWSWFEVALLLPWPCLGHSALLVVRCWSFRLSYLPALGLVISWPFVLGGCLVWLGRVGGGRSFSDPDGLPAVVLGPVWLSWALAWAPLVLGSLAFLPLPFPGFPWLSPWFS